MATPFKMKGSPMQRNFGIGASPARHEPWTAAHKEKVAHGNTKEAHLPPSPKKKDKKKKEGFSNYGQTKINKNLTRDETYSDYARELRDEAPAEGLYKKK